MVIDFFSFQFPDIPGIHCIFQFIPSGCQNRMAANISLVNPATRAEAINARKELAECLKKRGLRAWAECRQVHGVEILAEPRPAGIAETPELEADGMMTSQAGLGLMIKTADCQPVLLANMSGKYIMAIHVGWRGNRANFPQKAVTAFCERYNLNLADVLAVRGPSLGPANARFINFASEWGDNWLRWHDRRAQTMDLWALTRHQLEAAGLPRENIFGFDICTMANPAHFFSYRGDKTSGRQGAIIWMDGGHE